MSTPHMNLQPIEAGGSTGIPAHMDDRPDVQYRGPTMRWLIKNQKFAHQLIATQHTAPEGSILDYDLLALLRLYVQDPSPAGVETLLKDHGMWDEGAPAGQEARSGVVRSGCLVGYVIIDGGFDEGSIQLLREWFGSGVLDTELEGVEPWRFEGK